MTDLLPRPGVRRLRPAGVFTVLLGLAPVSLARAAEPQALAGAWVGERSNGLGGRSAVSFAKTIP